MKTPNKLMIGGIPYQIKIVDGFIDEKPNGDVVTGQIVYFDQEILLSNRMQTEYGAKVLLHEAIHGMLHEFGMDRYNKEHLVAAFTGALYDFIQSNDLSFVQKNMKSLQVAVKSHTPTKVEVEKVKDQGRPRKLPLINASDTAFPLAEVAKITTGKTEESEDNSFWETGIKIKDEDKCYRTWYVCPECGNKGKHYVPEYLSSVECYQCKTPLEKRPATDKGFPDRDDFGNFFVATERY